MRIEKVSTNPEQPTNPSTLPSSTSALSATSGGQTGRTSTDLVVETRIEMKRQMREWAMSQAAYYLSLAERLEVEIRSLEKTLSDKPIEK